MAVPVYCPLGAQICRNDPPSSGPVGVGTPCVVRRPRSLLPCVLPLSWAAQGLPLHVPTAPAPTGPMLPPKYPPLKAGTQPHPGDDEGSVAQVRGARKAAENFTARLM
jgi:hypothetical protein